MLKRFTLRNYKNFKDEITMDFGDVAGYQFSLDCIKDGLITKMLIYGRNATGKTNLGRAIMDIDTTINTRVRGVRIEDNGVFLNADSKEEFASFSYTFIFDNDEILYKYTRYSSQELLDEELLVNGNMIYKCDFVNEKFDFENLKDIDADTAKVERYLQVIKESDEIEGNIESQISFLRWLINNGDLKNDSLPLKMFNYVRSMRMINVGSGMLFQSRLSNRFFYDSLEDEKKLQDLQDFLNAMGIDCKLILQKLPDNQNMLYFAHDKLVPFYENASSGTLALVDFYRRAVHGEREVSFIYLDEFDAFYHYEMANNMIRFFKKKYPRCQMIMTTHNTNLMSNRLMRPDCMFILSGMGTLTSLCNATRRELREGHNLEKMYIGGEFEKYE